jgi:RAB protein geranylgeranyltransferase component A
MCLFFLSNRFANAEGAFIYPMYGHGELPQAFCRFAAVKGALYVRSYSQSISGFGFTL